MRVLPWSRAMDELRRLREMGAEDSPEPIEEPVAKLPPVVFGAEPQPVEVSVLPGAAGTAAFVACRYCLAQVVVYSAPLFVIGRIARGRGWTNIKNGLGWLCPVCSAAER